MAYEEFSGELDKPTKFEEFNGQLDKAPSSAKNANLDSISNPFIAEKAAADEAAIAAKMEAAVNGVKKPGLIERVADFFKPDPVSVMEGYQPTAQEQQAQLDRRLSYGAGPISSETVAKADEVRSGLAKANNKVVERTVKGMERVKAPSFGDLVEKAKDPTNARAARNLQADEFRSAGEWALDTISSLSQGTVGLVQLPINIIAPSSDIANSLRETQKELQAAESDVLKASRERLKERVLNEEGFFDKYFATVQQLITDPTLTISEAAKQLPNFFGVVGAARVVGGTSAGVAKIAGSSTAVQTAVRGVGTTAGGASASMVMAGGDAAGNVYETLTDRKKVPLALWLENPDFQQLVKSGRTEKQAIEEIATAKARMAALITAPLGLFGYIGAESAIASKGLGRATAEILTGKGMAKAAAKDLIGEQVEEGGTQFGGNLITRTVNPEQSLTEGVPEAAATALVTSAPFTAAGIRSQYKEAMADRNGLVSGTIAGDPIADIIREKSNDPIGDVIRERASRTEPTLPDGIVNGAGVASSGRIEPTLTSFTPADSPSAQAGLAPIVVPVTTAVETAEVPQVNTNTERAFGLDQLRMGGANVSTGSDVGTTAGVGSIAGSDQLGRGLGVPGSDVSGTAGVGATDAGTNAVNAGSYLAARSDAEKQAASITPQENNNAVVQPTEQWFGRKGDGYATQADAAQALPGRKRMFPELNWSVEPMPSGNFRLAGYDANTQETSNVGQAIETQQAEAQGSQAPVASARQLNDLLDRQSPLSDAVLAELSRNPAAADNRRDTQAYLDDLVARKLIPEAPKLGAPDTNSETTVSALGQLFGEATGTGNRVVAYSEPGGQNGFSIGGIAFVNTSLDSTAIDAPRTTLHELKHVTEQLAAADTTAGRTNTPAQQFVEKIDGIFDDITDEGKRAYIENFLHKEELDKITDPVQRTARVQELLNAPMTRSEMTADFLGNRSQDREFLISLAKADPKGFEGFVSKWLAVIDNLLAKLKGGKTQGSKESAKVDQYVRDLNKAKMVARDALVAFRKGNMGEQQQVVQADAVSASARQRSMGAMELTQDLFKPQTEAERRSGFAVKLNNPVTLKDGSRLSGFTDPAAKTTFYGYDKNGERFTIKKDAVSADDIVSSKDTNKTADAVRASLTSAAPAASLRQADFANPEERVTVSTAQPTAKPDRKTGYQPDSYTEKRVIDTQDIKDSKGHVKTIVDALRKYNTLTGKGDAKQVLQELHRVVVDNLLWLHDHVNPEVRARAKLWYDGANKIATDWSKKFDLNTRQTGGILAVFSPQMDWFKNVSLAERALVVMTRHANETWSKGMTDWAESWLNASADVATKSARSKDLENMRRIAKSGKKFKDMSNEDAAYFIRAFDEAYFSRNYRLVTPEGGFDSFVVNDDGTTLSSVTWGGFGTIEKAVSIFRDGSFRNVDQQLGGEHKVRNFYNNIVDPNNADGHVTIDTHAVAAAFVKPLSGNSIEVAHNLGGLGSNAATGASGSYALYADAYRDAAAQRGILAREMQSITWEAVRALFPAETKSGLSSGINAIWNRVKAGELTREEAREEIIKVAGGVRAFAWEGGGAGTSAADGATSFETAIAEDPAKREVRTMEAKTAKDKIQVSLAAATNTIPGIRKLYELAQGKDTAAHALLQDIGYDSLKHLLSGTSASIKVEPATGLYGGASEPSLSMTISFADNERDIVLAALEKFAQNFNQEQVHVRQGTKDKTGTKYEDGSYATPSYRWDLKKALDRKKIQKVIDESGLYGLTFGDTFVEAYYVGDVANEENRKEFDESIARADRLLGRATAGIGRSVTRLWPYGYGDGAIGYERIRGDISPREAVTSVTAKRVAEYLKGAKVKVFEQASEITPKQEALQREIAAVYESLPDNDLKNPRVRKAYDELAKEVVRQFNALPVKVEVMTGQGEPYSSSAAMRRDILDNNHLFIFGTTPETFGPEGADFTGHPLLEDTGIKDQNGYPLLANDLLRAVHDYYAHAMAPTQFGPKGEEAAWKNHMSMTTSPWARWALTAETRGQNSWVNFRPMAKGVPVKERSFAPQKTVLLPIEYSMTGDRNVDAVMRELEKSLPDAAKAGSKPAKKMSDAPAFSKRQVTPLGFYSALADGVEQMKASALPAVGWKDAIKGMLNKAQVKADEIEWTGINDWLDLQQGKVTKDQVLGYLNSNGVQVEEVMKTSAQSAQVRPAQVVGPNESGYYYVEHSDGTTAGPFFDESEAIDELDMEPEATASDTKYASYQLPGGENYRELLLTLPDSNEAQQRFNELKSGGMRSLEASRQVDTEFPSYRSSHWDEANVLAHIRFNDRTDADGNKVLFIEEMQSDWAQEGRKKGFINSTDSRAVALLAQAEEEFYVLEYDLSDGDFSDEQKAEKLGRMATLKNEIRILQQQAGSSATKFNVPAAPFVTKTDAWLSLGIKRMISYAVDNGYDKIAFVNGEQSADRYDLSKSLSRVAYREGRLQGYNKDGALVMNKSVEPADLPDYVGKELGAKIAENAQKDIEVRTALRQAIKNDLPETQVDALREQLNAIPSEYAGLDLKVGGEGMKSFYDKIVPKVANDVLKKIGGGKIETTQLATTDNRTAIVRRNGSYSVLNLYANMGSENEYTGTYATRAEAEAAMNAMGMTEQPSLTITDAMREKVSQGLPMFSKRQAEGAIKTDEDVVKLFTDMQNARGLKAVRAKEAMDAHPMGEQLAKINNDFYDILEGLDDAGLVQINC